MMWRFTKHVWQIFKNVVLFVKILVKLVLSRDYGYRNIHLFGCIFSTSITFYYFFANSPQRSQVIHFLNNYCANPEINWVQFFDKLFLNSFCSFFKSALHCQIYSTFEHTDIIYIDRYFMCKNLLPISLIKSKTNRA